MYFLFYLFVIHFFLNLTGDEVWNFGFAYNIYRGLIPYRDFNLVVTPFYSVVLSFFIFLFGPRLFAMHILNALIVSVLSCYFVLKFRARSIFIIPNLFVLFFPGYNAWSLFLFFLIIMVIEYKKKNSDVLLGFLVSLLFLSKQSIGIAVFVSYIFYAKNKLKAFISFMIPICLLVIYFVWNNALYQFIDYCFFGLLNFGSQNKIFLFLPLEIIVVLFLGNNLYKSKFEDKKAFYVLSFQILAYPIFDTTHLWIAFIPFLYYLLDKYSFSFVYGYKYKYFLITVVTSFLMFSFNICHVSDGVFSPDKSSFLYGRYVDVGSIKVINYLSNCFEDVKNDYDYVFLFTKLSYVIKLNSGYVLNKYDLINDGNMGYNGDIRYINEVDDICSNNSCLFFLDKYEFGDDGEDENQTSKKILNYVYKNYDIVKHLPQVGFDLYSNKKE